MPSAPTAPDAERLIRAVLDVAAPIAASGSAADASDPAAAREFASRLDGGDAFVNVAISTRMALSLWDAHQDWAVGISDLEADHGRDVAVRALAVGALAQKLGGERAILATGAGRDLLRWLAAVELALARTPVDEPLGGRALSDVLDTFGDDAADALATTFGADAHAARRLIGTLAPSVDACAAACDAARVADAVRGALPPLPGNDRDALAGEAARLPVYAVLLGRLIEEVAGGGADATAHAEAERL
ncbi:MAG: hypothetical protein ACOZNI_36925, partial [Myxococcota bacterium]